MKQFTTNAVYTTLFPLLSLILFASCNKDSVSLTFDESAKIVQRTCHVVTQDWSNNLKSVASVQLTEIENLEISAIERTSDSTYVFYNSDELIGKTIYNTDNFLFIVSNGTFNEEIVGYYDPNNAHFCDLPDSSQLLIGQLQNIVHSTLGILGVDSDSF